MQVNISIQGAAAAVEGLSTANLLTQEAAPQSGGAAPGAALDDNGATASSISSNTDMGGPPGWLSEAITAYEADKAPIVQDTPSTDASDAGAGPAM